MSTPQTTINICSNVRLDNRYVHSIYFPSVTAQLDYFAGKVVKTFSGYSYCRKSWSIKVDAKLEDARKWNYLYFQNTPTGKWWFYFINQVEYVNDNTVELTLELDVIQTYLTDITFNNCYVERQHTVTDVFGANEVDEGLDPGEMRCIQTTDITNIEDLCVLMLCSFDPYSTTTKDNMNHSYASRYNNVFGGLGIYATPLTLWETLGMKLKLLSEAGLIDGIVSMWMYPKELVTLAPGASWDNPHICMGVSSVEIKSQQVTLSSISKWYVVKNMKTLQYPFHFLYVSNNQGGSAVYRFERFEHLRGTSDFYTKDCTLRAFLYGAYSPDASVKMTMEGYEGMPHEYSISIGQYPTCAWNADTYKIWLAQNQNQHKVAQTTAGLTVGAGVGTAIIGGMSGNPIMAGSGVISAVGGLTQISQLNAQKKDMSIQPPQARGVHSASVNIMSGKQTFTLYHKIASPPHLYIVDNFFTMYGYAIKRVLTPNINARPGFTYIKTVGCTVRGNLCNEDRVKFESIIDNGITFWKNGDNIGDYSIDNSPTE